MVAVLDNISSTEPASMWTLLATPSILSLELASPVSTTPELLSEVSVSMLVLLPSTLLSVLMASKYSIMLPVSLSSAQLSLPMEHAVLVSTQLSS